MSGGWRLLAACAGQIELFDVAEADSDDKPEPGRPRTAAYHEAARKRAKAKRVCASCPVQLECLSAAVKENDRFLIRGGLTARDRRKYKLQKRGKRYYNPAGGTVRADRRRTVVPA